MDKRQIVIPYTKTVRSEAMKKGPNQSGIIFTNDIDRDQEPILKINAMNPVTQKQTTHLEMQIPLVDLPLVIDNLKRFLI